MEKNSFYDLDYIISLNEKRLEQYSNAYQKNTDKFTNILILYSAIAVFLVPIIQKLFLNGTIAWANSICFILFALLFGYSLIFTIKLLIPVNVAYLIEPKTYYEKFRLEYEAEERSQEETDKLVKASYINELEKAVATNNLVFKRKGLFYYRALISGLIACVPYIICIAFHFSNKSDDIQKVEIVNSNKISTFNKSSNMSNEANKNNNNTTSSTTTTTTQLPGVNVRDVKPSNPQMVKENFQNQEKKQDSGKKNSK